MKILVIGGSGFIGKPLLANLVNQTDFCITNIYRNKSKELHKKVNHFCVNRKDIPQLKRLLAKQKFDIVIDLCAFSAKDIHSILETISTDKYIFLSSSAVYDSSGGEFTEESTPKPAPGHKYGINKLMAEKALASFRGVKIIIRPAVVYGERDSNIYRAQFFFHQLQNNQKLIIPGTAYKKNNYIYVVDLVDLIVKSTFLDESVILNGGGKIFDWYEYIRVISDIIGKKTIIENMLWSIEQFREIAKKDHINFPHNVFHDFVIINNLAREKLGWFPTVDLVGGLTNTWNWLKEIENATL